MTRAYTLKVRAERRDETRRRILEAASELHAAHGAARTSLQAIAERAGVTRPTVYAHFPDMQSLVHAVGTFGIGRDWLPDPASWPEGEEPLARLRRVLVEVYGFYRRNEVRWENILVDLRSMAEARRFYEDEILERMRAMRDGLAQGWPLPPARRRLLLAALEHALDYSSWHSLARRQDLEDSVAVELMVSLVLCAAVLESPPVERRSVRRAPSARRRPPRG